MSLGDRLVAVVTSHSVVVAVGMLVLTLVIGAGVAGLDQSPGLNQFEFESEERQALSYIENNFAVDTNRTAVQIVLRDQDNALSRDSFIATLELQRDIQTDPDIEPTLVDAPFQDLASVVATQAIRAERAAALEAAAAQLQADRAAAATTARNLTDLLNATREHQTVYSRLNASYEAGEIDEQTYRERADTIENNLTDVEETAASRLRDGEIARFLDVMDAVRTAQRAIVQTQIAYEAGQISEEERDAQLATQQSTIQSAYQRIESDVLAERFTSLQERAATLEAEQEALRNLTPDLDTQIAQLEGMSDEEVESLVGNLLSDDAPVELFVFLPDAYEPGDTQAEPRTLFVTQTTGGAEVVEGEAPAPIIDSQLAISDHVDQRFGDSGFAFGVGILSDEIDRSMGDSLGIVVPLALIFVVVVLTIAYRDLLDILLGVVGIAFVLLWTFGFMGWTGITFNQIMIAVPVLLVGLSIDYAIHVFMRHRERRAEGDPDTRDSMAFVLIGLGMALIWVTLTAMIGFLANLVSPVPPIRDFGIVSAVGILATLLIFGLFVPATKVELDDRLEARGFDRQKRAFGTGGGTLSGILNLGRRAADRAPWAVVLLALLLTAGGVAGAAQVDTEFRQEDFIASDPPAWMDVLPAGLAPGDYHVKDQLDYVNDRFVRRDVSTQVLVRGDITDPDTLERFDTARDDAADRSVVATLSTGEANVQTPLTAMQRLAAQDPDFGATFAAADTDGDGVPEEDLATVYDAYFEAAPEQAPQLIYRTDEGSYEAARMRLSIRGDATAGDATAATRGIANGLATESHSAVATGQLVVFHVIEDALFDAVLQSLLVTLIGVFGVLMVAYRWFHGSTLLGAITLLPIVLAVAWILGTMFLLDIPFNVITGTITSLTVGLGVAYNIHISERYRLERRSGYDPDTAMGRAVTGTGGALLGSAATTVGGFGVLVFAILPPLQQFGLITGITIIYAFLASVFVLPSFLRLWTRFGGEATEVPTQEPAGGDG